LLNKDAAPKMAASLFKLAMEPTESGLLLIHTSIFFLIKQRVEDPDGEAEPQRKVKGEKMR
jgi:hypothetical protein